MHAGKEILLLLHAGRKCAAPNTLRDAELTVRVWYHATVCTDDMHRHAKL